ncbi:F0F1 ATP synthase subunit I [Legionella sp. MW5194]|uniref:ATP synthase subunit I n=1 Tax=Legionella sp. MW5194 TaxID=2662448 RepID=UPI00193EA0A7|nr:ATP synthase subunit I [Legionella sp. MW5194]QRN04984.1 F0F1 ATP synthase subunit I [Legionella sp. MW5194]
MALVLVLFYGQHEAISALLGGLVAVLPSFFFARTLFKHQGARAAKKIINRFYAGEALKILISIGLFILVFTFYKVKPLAFFLTYIVVVLNFWFTPLFLANKQNRPKSD